MYSSSCEDEDLWERETLRPLSASHAQHRAGLAEKGRGNNQPSPKQNSRVTRRGLHQVGEDKPNPGTLHVADQAHPSLLSSRGEERPVDTISDRRIHGPQPNVPHQRTDGAQCAFDDSMIH